MAEGRYYWLKLKRDFFKRHDIVIIESMPNGKDYILFYLKLLCESVDNSGSLRFSDKIPYNEDMLATITRTNIDIVRNAIKLFSELGMMEIMDDGTYYMSEVAKITGSESEWAEKKRTYRQSQKKLTSRGQNEDNVLPSEDNVRGQKDKVRQEKEIDIETDIEREKEKEKKASPSGQLGALLEQYEFSARLKESLLAYADHMDECGKPLSTRSMDLVIRKLQRIAASEDEMVEILENSVRKGWKDIYPLDRPKNQSPAVRSFGDYEQRKTNYSELEKMMYAADDKGEGFNEE